MLKTAAYVLATLLAVQKPSQVFVKGHGYLETLKSRNYYAYWNTLQVGGYCKGEEACPPSEYCYHCLNSNTGVCGSTASARSYETTDWKDKLGSPMPFEPQETYAEGETITLISYLDTHHGGHMEARACNMDTSACDDPSDFDGNELEFVRDLIFADEYYPAMQKDANYPERGYYAGGQGGGVQRFAMDFKLPVGIFGNVLLQWRYITANSCAPPGYADYFASLTQAYPDQAETIYNWWSHGLKECGVPYPNDGNRDLPTNPEQFFNCAEIKVTGTASPTVSPKPTGAPTTDSPTVKSPTNTPIAPVTPPPVQGCFALWEDCTYNWDNCCGDMQCRQVDLNGYGRCLAADTCGNPNPPPTSTPPPPPAGTCCYDRNTGYQTCKEEASCSLSSENCDNCVGLFLDAPLVRDGCCSWGGNDCSGDDPTTNRGCHYWKSDCEGSCGGNWMYFA